VQSKKQYFLQESRAGSNGEKQRETLQLPVLTYALHGYKLVSKKAETGFTHCTLAQSIAIAVAKKNKIK
jgi:hypothetical protein